MIRVFDVLSGKKFEYGPPDLYQITIGQRVLVNKLIVDIRSIGAAHVTQHNVLSIIDELRMIARYRFLIDLNIAF
jgi:hypothetical protein